MSLAKIKSCLKKVKEDESSLCWVEEEIADLLYAIAEHLLELGKEHETIADVPAGWVRVIDFVRQEKVFPYGTVSALMSKNPSFREKYSLRIGNKVFIDPIAVNTELRKSAKVKNMLARFNCS